MSNKGNGGPYSMMGGPNGPKGPNGRGAVARAAPNEALLGHFVSNAPPVVTGIKNMVANLKRRQANVTRRQEQQRRRAANLAAYRAQRAAETTRSPPRNHTIVHIREGGSKRKTRNRRRR